MGVWLLGRTKRQKALDWLCRVGGPLVIGIFWLHGVFFNPPNNWATIDKYGFWKFWFMPHPFYRLVDNFALVLFLCLPGLAILAYAFFKSRKTVDDVPTLNIKKIVAYFFILAAALCLRPIPDQIMDIAMHMSHWFNSPGILIRTHGPIVIACLLLAGMSWVFAVRIQRPSRPADESKLLSKSRWVRVTNLPEDLEQDDLRRVVERHGTLRSIVVKSNQEGNQAVIEMKNNKHARCLTPRPRRRALRQGGARAIGVFDLTGLLVQAAARLRVDLLAHGASGVRAGLRDRLAGV